MLKLVKYIQTKDYGGNLTKDDNDNDEKVLFKSLVHTVERKSRNVAWYVHFAAFALRHQNPEDLS